MNKKQLKEVKSIHFIPAHKTNFLDNILNNKIIPDALCFDLEDSVLPESKNIARENLIKMLKENESKIKKFLIGIRPNKENTSYYKEDVKAIQKINPDFILLAKVESKKEIKRARKLYKNKPLIVAIETIIGVENIDKIISCLNKSDAVVVGYEDLSGELQIERPENLSLVNPLTHLIFDVYKNARKHNIIIFDAVCRFFKKEDLHILKKECIFTSNLRFSGKFSIHPNQIELINQYFDKIKLKKIADDITNRFNKIRDGSAVIVKDRQMMDTPSLKLYEKYKTNKK